MFLKSAFFILLIVFSFAVKAAQVLLPVELNVVRSASASFQVYDPATSLYSIGQQSNNILLPLASIRLQATSLNEAFFIESSKSLKVFAIAGSADQEFEISNLRVERSEQVSNRVEYQVQGQLEALLMQQLQQSSNTTLGAQLNVAVNY